MLLTEDFGWWNNADGVSISGQYIYKGKGSKIIRSKLILVAPTTDDGRKNDIVFDRAWSCSAVGQVSFCSVIFGRRSSVAVFDRAVLL